MFGYVVVNKLELKFKEFDIYHSYYCGLCRKLKERHGVFGQMTLNYDMTFVILLLTGLYEPDSTTHMTRCIAHPMKKNCTRSNDITEYIADMNLLMAYYKCKDDWSDDKKILKLAYSKLLEGKCRRIETKYEKKIEKIDTLLKELSIKENNHEYNIDEMAGYFGDIMAEIFLYKEDEWYENLNKMGFYLGKFIYLMDAYDDIEDDINKNNYNPLISLYEGDNFEEESRRILMMMIAECSKEFEKLPIFEHVEILRNILYSGVWTRFQLTREKRRKKQGEVGE